MTCTLGFRSLNSSPCLYPDIIAEIMAGLRNVGCDIRQDETTDLFSVNNEFSVSLVIARCSRTPANSLRWCLRFDTGLLPDFTIAVRMDSNNRQRLDYYVLPRIDITRSKLKLAEDNGLALDAYRFDTLDGFYRMAARVSIRMAA